MNRALITAKIPLQCYSNRATWKRVSQVERYLRTFAPKCSHAQNFLKLTTQKGNDILLPKRQKKLGVTDFVLERTCPEKYPNSEKSASLADKATVSVSPKILQLDLLN